MFGLRRVEPAVKRREMSCSRAPRVFAGRRLSLLLFCRLAFLSLASPLLPQCPSFTGARSARRGQLGSEAGEYAMHAA